MPPTTNFKKVRKLQDELVTRASMMYRKRPHEKERADEAMKWAVVIAHIADMCAPDDEKLWTVTPKQASDMVRARACRDSLPTLETLNNE